MENRAQFLNMFKADDEIIIDKLLGGDNFRKKLIDQGIYPGVKVTIISGKKHHPYLVRVNNSRVMIGSGMVDKIMVRKG